MFDKLEHWALLIVAAYVVLRVYRHFTAVSQPVHANGADYIPGQYIY